MENISILLATYNPNLNFFSKLLESLNKQDYSDYEIIILDDCSSPECFREIQQISKKILTLTDYKIIKNPHNMGSSKSFETLTRTATGKYLAFCDQDDIWDHNKLSVLHDKILENKAVVAYSDLRVINEKDEILCENQTSYMPRVKHKHGMNIYGYFFDRNCITGCTMLVRSDVAKSALPFPDSSIYVHDHWLALYSSCKGNIAFADTPLISYRIHSENQVGAKIFDDIHNKKDYFEFRLLRETKRSELLAERKLKTISEPIEKEIVFFHKFIQIRTQYLIRPFSKHFIKMFGIFKKDPVLILFEIILGITPNLFSPLLFKIAKK